MTEAETKKGPRTIGDRIIYLEQELLPALTRKEDVLKAQKEIKQLKGAAVLVGEDKPFIDYLEERSGKSYKSKL